MAQTTMSTLISHRRASLREQGGTLKPSTNYQPNFRSGPRNVRLKILAFGGLIGAASSKAFSCLTLRKRNRAVLPTSINKLRDDYATHPDFCEIFEKEMKPLYLLAFLLTGNHASAELCLLDATDEGFGQNSVFKEWMGAWVKRSVIKRAIRDVFKARTKGNEVQDLWSEEPNPRSAAYINAVTQLVSLERFVYVMSVLEGYSIKECSLLLNCSMTKAVEGRVNALQALPFNLSSVSGKRAEECLAATA